MRIAALRSLFVFPLLSGLSLAQAASLDEVARTIRATRAKIKTLSHEFSRTYPLDGGATVQGRFVTDQRGNRRFDLGHMGGRGRSETYRLRGQLSDYVFSGAGTGKLRLQNVDYRKPGPRGMGGAGLLDHCCELFEEDLATVVAGGKFVDETGELITLESKIGKDTPVTIKLSKANGYLCQSWETHRGNENVVYHVDAWKTVGGVSLPSKGTVELYRDGKLLTRHQDEFKNIRVNAVVAPLLIPPKLISGTHIKDENKGLLYEVGAGGALVPRGKIDSGGFSLETLARVGPILLLIVGVTVGGFFGSKLARSRRPKNLTT